MFYLVCARGTILPTFLYSLGLYQMRPDANLGEGGIQVYLFLCVFRSLFVLKLQTSNYTNS